MPNPKRRTKSDRLLDELVKRGEAHGGIYDDWTGLYAFLEAAAEEALTEKAKPEKAREKADAKP